MSAEGATLLVEAGSEDAADAFVALPASDSHEAATVLVAPRVEEMAQRLGEREVGSRVVLVLAARPLERRPLRGASSLEALAPAEVGERVTAPIAAVAATLRQVVDRWMEDGLAGVLVLVLVRAPEPDVAADMLEAGLSSLVRSLAKEQGRRGARTLLLVTDRESAGAAAEVAGLMSSDAGALVTGETFTLYASEGRAA